VRHHAAEQLLKQISPANRFAVQRRFKVSRVNERGMKAWMRWLTEMRPRPRKSQEP
jgi:hypothetical protein